ncbi:MAG: tandem-95 repeat protein, partial [Candidatus Marinimicrobia bacterium]|nr:tandem-95 repeat protein [Candidatus Neomarinimicrobiota bacterium]
MLIRLIILFITTILIGQTEVSPIIEGREPSSTYSNRDDYQESISKATYDTGLSSNEIYRNEPPVVEDIETTTNEDTPVVIALIGTDADGDDLSYEIVSPPINGTFVDSIYTPNANYFGRDVFTFVANDGEIDSNIGTVVVWVESVNDFPMLSEIGEQKTNEDEDFSLLFRVFDADGDSLIYNAFCSDSSLVEITIYPNGERTTSTLVFDVMDDQNGSTDITIEIGDQHGGTDTETFVFTVYSVNDQPTADDIAVTTDEDTPVEITLSGNDIDGDELTFEVVDAPTNGVYEGGIYTPNANYFGEDTFTFIANDTEFDSDPATVTITIAPVNDTPTIDLPDSFTFDEDGSLTEDFTQYLDDIDGDVLTLSVSGNTEITVEIVGF